MSNMDDKIGKASFSMVDEFVKERYVFGKYVEKEMLTKLKALALNHDKPGVTPDSIRPLWDLIRVREVMALSNISQRKRKLQQFLKDNFKCEARKLCDKQREAKYRRGQLSRTSSASCVHNMNMDDSTKNLHKQILLNSLSSGSLLTSEDKFERLPYVNSIMDNAKDWYQSDRITSFLVDVSGSVHGSNPVTPEHMNIQEPESLHLEDVSNSSNLEESIYDRLPSHTNKFFYFLRNQFERMAVPVGNHFQADVPEWCGPSSQVNGDSDTSRWLGTKVWPIERQIVKATSRAVGKGRPSSCSCASPGSTNCIKHHILEKRCLLLSDLGPLFHIWKFDEMGEEVSKSWTVKEQESFDLIAKRKSSSSNFIQNAMKSLPSKCKKDITGYYFNFFIPRFMSSQTRSLIKEVDIDIDDVNDVYTLIIRSRKDSSSGRSCKDVISR